MTHRFPACVALLAAAPAALAEDPLVDRSIDTQLVHPVFSPTGAVAVDSPRAGEPMSLSLGAAWQVENRPLNYALEGGGSGAAIARRNTLHLGMSLAVSERSTVYLRGSGALLEPGDLDLVAPAQAMALGDLALGIKGAWFERGQLALGPGVTVWLPVGSDDSWAAERALRYAPSLLAAYGGDRVGVLLNLGVLARVQVDSGADFVASPELSAGLATTISPTAWLSGVAELGSRHGLVRFLEPGAENPVEFKGGLRLRAAGWGQLDLLAGTGLSKGYGTSDLRYLVSVTGHVPLRRDHPGPQPVAVVAPPPAAPEPVAEPEPVAVPAAAPQRAWVERGRALLESPIAFEPGSASLLPSSEPMVEALAQLMHAYPQIELLVVEGHADDLGSAAADFELSLRRSRTVFEGLVARAVPPSRVSYQGLGSADPQAAGAPRGVGLVIARVRPLQEGPAPWSPDDILLPWSGEAVAAVPPGDKLLGSDAHPILAREPIPSAQPVDQIPSGESFLQALDDETDAPEAP